VATSAKGTLERATETLMLYLLSREHFAVFLVEFANVHVQSPTVLAECDAPFAAQLISERQQTAFQSEEQVRGRVWVCKCAPFSTANHCLYVIMAQVTVDLLPSKSLLDHSDAR
jgi:hypothetical protein